MPAIPLSMFEKSSLENTLHIGDHPNEHMYKTYPYIDERFKHD